MLYPTDEPVRQRISTYWQAGPIERRTMTGDELIARSRRGVVRSIAELREVPTNALKGDDSGLNTLLLAQLDRIFNRVDSSDGELQGLIICLGAVNETALSVFLDGGDAAADAAIGLLEDVLRAANEAKALKGSMAETVDPNFVVNNI